MLKIKGKFLAAAIGLLTAFASTAAVAQTLQSWMSPEVSAAWKKGYKGKGTTITVVDDFKSSYGYYGDLGLGYQLRRHGEWTRLETQLIAPAAAYRSIDYTTGKTISLASGKNVFNLSYGMYARAGYSVTQIGWAPSESSIINYAKKGTAIISKAAGNDSVAIGAAASDGYVDYLNLALVGSKTGIFVGALDHNGAVDNKAALAEYSNYAGTNVAVQQKFLVVGVEANETGLAGTSFAAPIISGYAAILGSKFTSATPTQITNQLLKTARKDTLLNYDVTIYGQGEASLTRALAPVKIY